MAFPTNPTDGQIYDKYAYSSTTEGWQDMGVLYGGSSVSPAPSAAYIKSLYPGSPNGTYWIDVNNTPTELYCNMEIRNGGWMSFASAPASGGWFSGDSGNGAPWNGLSYSYGTYDKHGSIGDYWRDFSKQNVTELLFLTGNKQYWISFPISLVSEYPDATTLTEGVHTSNNFPVNNYDINTSINIYHRLDNNGEDPWIQAGNDHANGYDRGSSYMFWGENSHDSHRYFKNDNGGILVFIR